VAPVGGLGSLVVQLAHAAGARVIGQTFPLERAADAHVAMEARGTIGKTRLLI